MSAWGKAFGNAWGNAWGPVSTAPVPQPRAVVGALGRLPGPAQPPRRAGMEAEAHFSFFATGEMSGPWSAEIEAEMILLLLLVD
jgi:hypothetical protein